MLQDILDGSELGKAKIIKAKKLFFFFFFYFLRNQSTYTQQTERFLLNWRNFVVVFRWCFWQYNGAAIYWWMKIGMRLMCFSLSQQTFFKRMIHLKWRFEFLHRRENTIQYRRRFISIFSVFYFIDLKIIRSRRIKSIIGILDSYMYRFSPLKRGRFE